MNETKQPPQTGDETVDMESATASTTVAPEINLEEQIAQLQEQLLRARADFENFRRRIQKEREDALRYANESLLEELLPILDHFELGMKAAETTQDARSIAQGFSMVWTQLQKTLADFGVKPVDAIGKTFDPHVHEAVAQEISAEHPDNTVIAQHRRGYRLHDRLLRPATVVVSHTSADEHKS